MDSSGRNVKNKRRSEMVSSLREDPNEFNLQIFENALKDPAKRLAILDVLNSEKRSVFELFRNKPQTDVASASPVKRVKKKHNLESPTSLLRRRELEKLNRPESVQSVTSEQSTESGRSSVIPFDQILKDVVVFVEIKSKGNDRSGGARALLRSMGATVTDKLSRDVTHVVFKDGSYETYQRAKLMKVHFVSVLWLESSRRLGVKALEENYPALGTNIYDQNISLICSQMQNDYEEVIREEIKLTLKSKNELPANRESEKLNRRRTIANSSQTNGYETRENNINSSNRRKSQSKGNRPSSSVLADISSSSIDEELVNISRTIHSKLREKSSFTPPKSTTLNNEDSDLDSECGIVDGDLNSSAPVIDDSFGNDPVLQSDEVVTSNLEEEVNENEDNDSSEHSCRLNSRREAESLVDMELTNINLSTVQQDIQGNGILKNLTGAVLNSLSYIKSKTPNFSSRCPEENFTEKGKSHKTPIKGGIGSSLTKIGADKSQKKLSRYTKKINEEESDKIIANSNITDDSNTNMSPLRISSNSKESRVSKDIFDSTEISSTRPQPSSRKSRIKRTEKENCDGSTDEIYMVKTPKLNTRKLSKNASQKKKKFEKNELRYESDSKTMPSLRVSSDSKNGSDCKDRSNSTEMSSLRFSSESSKDPKSNSKDICTESGNDIYLLKTPQLHENTAIPSKKPICQSNREDCTAESEVVVASMMSSLSMFNDSRSLKTTRSSKNKTDSTEITSMPDSSSLKDKNIETGDYKETSIEKDGNIHNQTPKFGKGTRKILRKTILDTYNKKESNQNMDNKNNSDTMSSLRLSNGSKDAKYSKNTSTSTEMSSLRVSTRSSEDLRNSASSAKCKNSLEKSTSTNMSSLKISIEQEKFPECENDNEKSSSIIKSSEAIDQETSNSGQTKLSTAFVTVRKRRSYKQKSETQSPSRFSRRRLNLETDKDNDCHTDRNRQNDVNNEMPYIDKKINLSEEEPMIQKNKKSYIPSPFVNCNPRKRNLRKVFEAEELSSGPQTTTGSECMSKRISVRRLGVDLIEECRKAGELVKETEIFHNEEEAEESDDKKETDTRRTTAKKNEKDINSSMNSSTSSRASKTPVPVVILEDVLISPPKKSLLLSRRKTMHSMADKTDESTNETVEEEKKQSDKKKSFKFSRSKTEPILRRSRRIRKLYDPELVTNINDVQLVEVDDAEEREMSRQEKLKKMELLSRNRWLTGNVLVTQKALEYLDKNKNTENGIKKIFKSPETMLDDLGISNVKITKETEQKGETMLEHSSDEQVELADEFVHGKVKRQAVSQPTPKKRRFIGTQNVVPTQKGARRSTLDFQPNSLRLPKFRTKSKVEHKPTIVCTKMHKPEVETFTQIVKKLGTFDVEDEVSSRTTHLIAGEPKRTINMLRALVRGCWILKQEWLLKSLEKGKWLPEAKFELTEFSPTVQTCRLERQAFGPRYTMNIFMDCGPVYVARSTSPRCSDLKELIVLCKGKLARMPDNAKIVVGAYFEGLICVNECWVLDSISIGKLKNFKKYLLLCETVTQNWKSPFV